MIYNIAFGKAYDALKGWYLGFRECHVKPDLLLVYRKNNDIL